MEIVLRVSFQVMKNLWRNVEVFINILDTQLNACVGQILKWERHKST